MAALLSPFATSRVASYLRTVNRGVVRGGSQASRTPVASHAAGAREELGVISWLSRAVARV
jgi:hypothetical protein